MSKKTTPSFLIHLTGTGCISDELQNKWEGKENPHVWQDINEIQEIYDLPDEALHHVVDKAIMDASNDLLKTACICPPDIYGQNMGTGNRATYMVPEYVKALLNKKEAFYLGAGENFRAVAHISDVVGLFLIIIDNALRGGGEAQWGREGFYFGVVDEVRWKDVAIAIHKLGLEDGWLPAESKVSSWTAQEVGAANPSLPARVLLYIWGSNSRAESARARKLGWSPSGPTFWEALPQDVRIAVEKSYVQGVEQLPSMFNNA